MTIDEKVSFAKKELEKFKRIKFYEKPHIYTYIEDSGEETRFGTSVTSLVGEYEQPFDEEEVAFKKSIREGIPKEYILSLWHFDRDLACCKGTHTHAYNEYLWSNRPSYQYNKQEVIDEFGYDVIEPVWGNLMKICNKFYAKFHDRIIPIGLEQYIGSKDYDICGAIDFLAYSIKLDEFIIIDYKTNKEIKTSSFGGYTMQEPLDQIPDCNYYHYSLQLAIYKYLLEYETNIKVSPRKWLIWMNEKNDDFVLYECANLDEEAKEILEIRREYV